MVDKEVKVYEGKNTGCTVSHTPLIKKVCIYTRADPMSVWWNQKGKARGGKEE